MFCWQWATREGEPSPVRFSLSRETTEADVADVDVVVVVNTTFK